MILMHKSGSIRDAMAVLDRLTDVETDMDAVQGQILASANSVMLSTPIPRAFAVASTTTRGLNSCPMFWRADD